MPERMSRKKLRIAFLFIILRLVLSMSNIIPHSVVNAADSYLLSLDRPAYASSVEGNLTPDLAFDGKVSTNSRWGSSHGDLTQWIYVDLGASANINQVILRWQNAHSKVYQLQVSDDE